MSSVRRRAFLDALMLPRSEAQAQRGNRILQNFASDDDATSAESARRCEVEVHPPACKTTSLTFEVAQGRTELVADLTLP